MSFMFRTWTLTNLPRYIVVGIAKCDDGKEFKTILDRPSTQI